MNKDGQTEVKNKKKKNVKNWEGVEGEGVGLVGKTPHEGLEM